MHLPQAPTTYAQTHGTRTNFPQPTVAKHPLRLFQKQLHLPHSHDFPARPPGVHPKKGGAFTAWPGRFSHFCFDRGRLLRILPVFAKSMALNKIEAFTRITAVRRAMWGGLRPSRVRRVTVIRRLR